MSNADYAFQWLLNKGYSPQAAAGVVGNLVQESNVRPEGVVGDNGTAFGIAQWRGPRLAGLQQFAQDNGQDWRSLDAQLGFLDHELRTSEKSVGDALFAAPDVRAATRAAISYERPQGWTVANPEAGHGWANRFGAASALAGGNPLPGNTAPSAPATPGPFAPPTAAPQQPAQDNLGAALTLLAPEPSSTVQPLTSLPKSAQNGPFDGLGSDEIDVSAFQPRTTRRTKTQPQRT